MRMFAVLFASRSALLPGKVLSAMPQEASMPVTVLVPAGVTNRPDGSTADVCEPWSGPAGNAPAGGA